MEEKASPEVRLFVSHHSSTYETALQVEEQLARRGVTCWIAPRDVEPGEPFDKAISKAILQSAAILLLFCEKSDKSRHVKRELILADTAARPIIPLRLEAIAPGELAYHLADSQWIDWIDRREAVMDRVANQARQYASVVPAIDGPLPQTHRMPVEPEERRKPVWMWGVVAIIAALAIVSATWLLATRGNDEGPPPEIATEGYDGPIDELTAQDAADTAHEEDEPPEPTPTPMPTATFTPVTRPTNPAPRPLPTATATIRPAPLQSAAPLQRVVDGCRGAATDTEYLICADPVLGNRAREIGGLIGQVRDSLAGNQEQLGAFNQSQRSWFNMVKATCHDAACVTDQQAQRIARLQELLR